MVTVTTYELAVIARVLLTVKVEIVMAAMVLTMIEREILYVVWKADRASKS